MQTLEMRAPMQWITRDPHDYHIGGHNNHPHHYIADHRKESSITEEVEAELRPASRGSTHTPLLPSKKVADYSDVNNAR